MPFQLNVSILFGALNMAFNHGIKYWGYHISTTTHQVSSQINILGRVPLYHPLVQDHLYGFWSSSEGPFFP